MLLLLSILFWSLLWDRASCGPLPPINPLPPFYNPLDQGGSMFANVGRRGLLGEPLNVIISGMSSSEVLTKGGFLNYARAIGFSSECMNLHMGGPFWADLGDGNGHMNQLVELREHFNELNFGTCVETLVGGNHLRVYRQDGPKGQSRALFLAVSQEESILHAHTVSPNGYNYGRDRLVEAAKGITSFKGVTYHTTVQDVTGLIEPGWKRVNHNISQDGVVKLLTVTVTERIFDEKPVLVLHPLFTHPLLMPQILLVAVGVAITNRLRIRLFPSGGSD